MDLADLRPRKSSFKLKSTGREYTLRPVNLEDEIWLQEEFGADIVNMFKDDCVDMLMLSRIVYHQLEDKSDFVRQEVVVVDEDGNESTEFIGGRKLLLRMVVGMEDKLEMLKAFNATMGASRPEEKEEVKNIKKKTQLTGA